MGAIITEGVGGVGDFAVFSGQSSIFCLSAARGRLASRIGYWSLLVDHFPAGEWDFISSSMSLTNDPIIRYNFQYVE